MPSTWYLRGFDERGPVLVSNKRRGRAGASRPKKSSTKAVPQQTKRATPAWGKWTAMAVGLAAFVGVVALVTSGLGGTRGPSGIPEGARPVPVGDPRHLQGDIDYGVAVPAGGPHNPVWLNCGFYERPVPEENVLHSIEHAAAWVTYRPDVDDDTLGRLRSIGRDRRKVIVSEVADQETLIVATAWGWQLDLDSVDDPRLTQFLNEFESSLNAPEPGGVCSGGVGSPDA
jgi:hypothetical protein